VKKAKLSVLLGSIFIILVFSLGPASSTPLSSSSYSIPSLTISSGGHTGLQSSSYKLQDIKGQAVIGYGASSSYGLGIGGVYGTLVPAAVEIIRGEGAGYGLGPDDGLIQNTRIRIVDGNDIVVSWTRTGGIASVDIWQSADEDYNPDGTWATTDTNFTATERRYTGIVRNVPHKAYYRVVPYRTTRDNIHLRSNNAITVGKFDLVNLPAATNLISTPLVCFAGSRVTDVFSGQLDGLLFYDFNDANQTYVETTTLSHLSHGKSYWVTLPTARTVTIIGGVPNVAYDSTIYGAGKYNLIASPTAKAIAPFSDAGLPALGADNQAYLFDNAGQTYSGLRDTLFGFNPGLGYWYYNTGSDFSWTLTRP
jgi:hypothetical protein